MLPSGADPWLLNLQHDDPIAYFNLEAASQAFCIQVDLSDRHFNEDGLVLDVLRKLRSKLGGVISDDNGNEL